ncbi:MAG TPA: hypothetical protein VHF25_04520 [Nitriliruptorales bacterium]|nr:hypothetical protein [Nitriliruptorales bacterium]
MARRASLEASCRVIGRRTGGGVAERYPIALIAGLVAAAGLLLAVTVPLAHAQSGRTYTVAVTDQGYSDNDADGNGIPTSTRITAGDTVRWVWASGNQNLHTVTSLEDGGRRFDSDRRCGADPTPCRRPPFTLVVTFTEQGSYRYHSKVESDVSPLFLGVIDVAAAETPSEDPSPSPSLPSESPPAVPTEDPSELPSEGGAPGGGDPEGPAAPAPGEAPPTQALPLEPAPGSTAAALSGGQPASAPGPRRVSPLSGLGTRSLPADLGPVTAEDPAVAPALRYPGSVPLAGVPSPGAADEFAIEIPTGGRPATPGGLLAGVAVASVLGSAAAFGKLVLFGPPWG